MVEQERSLMYKMLCDTEYGQDVRNIYPSPFYGVQRMIRSLSGAESRPELGHWIFQESVANETPFGLAIAN